MPERSRRTELSGIHDSEIVLCNVGKDCSFRVNRGRQESRKYAIIYRGLFFKALFLCSRKKRSLFFERNKRNQRHGRMNFRNLDATKALGNGYAGNLLGNG